MKPVLLCMVCIFFPGFCFSLTAEDLSTSGVAKGNVGNYSELTNDLTRDTELKRENAEFYYNRGITKQNIEDYQGAIADCTKAIGLKVDYADAYFFRGLMWMMIDNPERYCIDLKMAAALGSTQAHEAYQSFKMCD